MAIRLENPRTVAAAPCRPPEPSQIRLGHTCPRCWAWVPEYEDDHECRRFEHHPGDELDAWDDVDDPNWSGL